MKTNNENNKRNRKRTAMFAAIALAVIIAISGTFAWFTATDSKLNRLKTAGSLDDTVEIFEIFEEPTDWKPGQEITKNVGVINSGVEPALVRLSFTEVLNLAKPSQGVPASYFTQAEATCTHVHDNNGTTCNEPAGPCNHDPDNDCDDCTYNPEVVIPILFDPASIKAAGSGWYQLGGTAISTGADTARAALDGLTLDAAILASHPNLEVYITCVTTTGASPRTTYSVVAFEPTNSPFSPYKNSDQKVTADFEINGTTKTVQLSDILYWQIDGRDTYTAVWPTAKPTPANILYSVAETLAKAAFPTIYGKYIEYNYDAIAAAITADKWFYNEDDGYFYFIGKVTPSMITPNLLESLTLNGDADSAYANLILDLIVDMEAIQCTEDTVVSVFFGGTAPTAGDSLAVYTALKAFCS